VRLNLEKIFVQTDQEMFEAFNRMIVELPIKNIEVKLVDLYNITRTTRIKLYYAILVHIFQKLSNNFSGESECRWMLIGFVKKKCEKIENKSSANGFLVFW
jgi:hypothetical protein